MGFVLVYRGGAKVEYNIQTQIELPCKRNRAMEREIYREIEKDRDIMIDFVVNFSKASQNQTKGERVIERERESKRGDRERD